MQLNPPLNAVRITDHAGLALLQDFFVRTKAADGVLGWDIETTPLKDFYFRRCRTIQFGNQTEQYVVDLLALCDGDSDLLFEAQGEYGKNLSLAPKLRNFLEILRPVLCSKDFLKVGVNLGFEYMSFYWLFGMRTFHFFDCSIVEKCIWAGAHSMKDYGFYSMEEMMGRYFKLQIDKELQTSFTLDGELSDAQIDYAALDTRFPLALKAAQTLILHGKTAKSLAAQGIQSYKTLQNIDPILTGDNLTEIAQIENDAVGAFHDMHIHGERIDREKWRERVNGKKAEMKALISDVLDPIFLPYVGSKSENITEEQIEAAKEEWKKFNIISDEELQLKGQIRLAKKEGDHAVYSGLEVKLTELESNRKEQKESLKTYAAELGKKRTRIKNLAAQCEGEALINYGSDAQLLGVLKGMKGLKGLTNLDDATLEKHEHLSVMAAIRRYHGLAKEIGTYGDAWATEWVTKPCKEEGWLHPGDGKLHCNFNQYDAETGRSSSSQPNAQNLPQDKELRSCFVADPPNEAVRISTCCDADLIVKESFILESTFCSSCEMPCQTKPEEYRIITADMAGAELRIIAEAANDPIWINAFSRGEDVHSVGTEILYAETWPKLALPDCAYFKLKENGEPARQKCKCPEHQELRNANKSTNFLLAYGGGPGKLASEIGKTMQEAKALMELHSRKFPRIWAYLEESGRNAKIFKKSFDMFGRRRLFPEPTWERATEKAKEDREERLQLDPDEAERNIQNFTVLHKRKPTKEELWPLTHRMPSQKEISNAFMAMHGTIERQGKNHAIQGTNATIAKIAMGAGYDKDGKPYLWHTLPQYRSKLLKFVHDELVVQAPKQHAETVAALIGDAFKRAAATKMVKVSMEFDFNIKPYWCK